MAHQNRIWGRRLELTEVRKRCGDIFKERTEDEDFFILDILEANNNSIEKAVKLICEMFGTVPQPLESPVLPSYPNPIVERGTPNSEERKIVLSLKPVNGAQIRVVATENDCVKDLYANQKLKDLNYVNPFFLWDNQTLDDSKKLSHYNLTQSSIIYYCNGKSVSQLPSPPVKERREFPKRLVFKEKLDTFNTKFYFFCEEEIHQQNLDSRIKGRNPLLPPGVEEADVRAKCAKCKFEYFVLDNSEISSLDEIFENRKGVCYYVDESDRQCGNKEGELFVRCHSCHKSYNKGEVHILPNLVENEENLPSIGQRALNDKIQLRPFLPNGSYCEHRYSLLDLDQLCDDSNLIVNEYQPNRYTTNAFRCIQPGCNGVMFGRYYKNRETLLKLRKQQSFQSGHLQCFNHNCNMLLTFEDENQPKKADCKMCNASFCVEHEAPWGHCDHFENDNFRFKAISYFVKQGMYNSCPKCQTTYNEGEIISFWKQSSSITPSQNLHVTCNDNICGTQFCYFCEKEFSQSKDEHDSHHHHEGTCYSDFKEWNYCCGADIHYSRVLQLYHQLKITTLLQQYQKLCCVDKTKLLQIYSGIKGRYDRSDFHPSILDRLPDPKTILNEDIPYHPAKISDITLKELLSQKELNWGVSSSF